MAEVNATTSPPRRPGDKAPVAANRKIKKHIEDNGILQKFVARKLDISDSWLCLALQGEREFTYAQVELLENLWQVKFV